MEKLNNDSARVKNEMHQVSLDILEILEISRQNGLKNDCIIKQLKLK